MKTIGLRESLAKVLFPNGISSADIPVTTNEMILIDGQNIESSSLAEIRDRYAQAELVYLIDSQATSTLISLARAFRVQLVPLQDLPALIRDLDHKSDQPVLAFWGVLPGLGTTTVAHAVATYLQTEYDLSVGVLGLNVYDPGSWVVSNPSSYLDDFKSYLSTKQLSPSKLRDSMDELPSGVRYVSGNRNQAIALSYPIEDITYLIDQTKQAFEVVVLDAGSILNTTAAIAAFQKASFHYAVVTDRLYVQQQFQNQVQHLLKPLKIDAERFFLIGNKMTHPQPKTLTTFAKAVRAQPLSTIGELNALASYAEQRPEPIKEFLMDKKYRQAIDVITEGIAAIHNYQKRTLTRGGVR